MIDNRPLVSLKEIYTEFSEYKDLLEEIKEQLKIDFYGVHGIYHWYFVYLNTQKIATHYNVSSKVFKLFSILHDSKRKNENFDKNHGDNAYKFILEKIKEDKLPLNDLDLSRLLFACKNHNKIIEKDNRLLEDLIVQICLDSDKLDLPRVGIIPKEKYLFTNYSKKIAKELQ